MQSGFDCVGLVFLHVFAFFALDIVISLISLLGYGIIEKINRGYLPYKSEFNMFKIF